MSDLWVSYWQMVFGGPLEKTAAIALTLTILLVAGVGVNFLLRWLSTPIEELNSIGTVTGKWKRPGYYSLDNFMDVSSWASRQLVYLPNSWLVQIDINGEKEPCLFNVSEDFYNQVSLGDRVTVWYQRQRFFGLNVSEIALV